MTYRVVVEVPESLAKNEKDAVYKVRERMERIDQIDRPLPNSDYQYNWTERVKSYTHVRTAERRGLGSPQTDQLQQASDLIKEVITQLKDPLNNEQP